ncbi:hypothetical protein CEXT_770851 [Caerostris extrusa]|uniref:DRBM domain-containing protein n=1 Tax=Caerostris extrusa TaxID=172846 RepID=A0AAV4QHH2_CAEEX|nr:hypothetical protein CEXT_770851 [Caerostris extrusa]
MKFTAETKNKTLRPPKDTYMISRHASNSARAGKSLYQIGIYCPNKALLWSAPAETVVPLELFGKGFRPVGKKSAAKIALRILCWKSSALEN